MPHREGMRTASAFPQCHVCTKRRPLEQNGSLPLALPWRLRLLSFSCCLPFSSYVWAQFRAWKSWGLLDRGAEIVSVWSCCVAKRTVQHCYPGLLVQFHMRFSVCKGSWYPTFSWYSLWSFRCCLDSVQSSRLHTSKHTVAWECKVCILKSREMLREKQSWRVFTQAHLRSPSTPHLPAFTPSS